MGYIGAYWAFSELSGLGTFSEREGIQNACKHVLTKFSLDAWLPDMTRLTRLHLRFE